MNDTFICACEIYQLSRAFGASKETTMPSLAPKVLEPREGLRLESGPGRDLVFKVTGDDTAGAFDYFTVEVAPKGGPPLHVHHKQDETIHVVSGHFKVKIGEETFELAAHSSSALWPARH